MNVFARLQALDCDWGMPAFGSRNRDHIDGRIDSQPLRVVDIEAKAHPFVHLGNQSASALGARIALIRRTVNVNRKHDAGFFYLAFRQSQERLPGNFPWLMRRRRLGVRRHDAAFDIQEWEGGVMPPQAKAPCGRFWKFLFSMNRGAAAAGALRESPPSS
jgi:hypothetical protein